MRTSLAMTRLKSLFSIYSDSEHDTTSTPSEVICEVYEFVYPDIFIGDKDANESSQMYTSVDHVRATTANAVLE